MLFRYGKNETIMAKTKRINAGGSTQRKFPLWTTREREVIQPRHCTRRNVSDGVSPKREWYPCEKAPSCVKPHCRATEVTESPGTADSRQRLAKVKRSRRTHCMGLHWNCCWNPSCRLRADNPLTRSRSVSLIVSARCAWMYSQVALISRLTERERRSIAGVANAWATFGFSITTKLR